MRKCDGLRDVGNLMDLSLEECLQRCLENPVCTSATWSASGNRCFLSSICDRSVSTSDYRFMLFEKAVVASGGPATTSASGAVVGKDNDRWEVDDFSTTYFSSNRSSEKSQGPLMWVAEWTPRV
eukprot:GSA25T00022056001.1